MNSSHKLDTAIGALLRNTLRDFQEKAYKECYHNVRKATAKEIFTELERRGVKVDTELRRRYGVGDEERGVAHGEGGSGNWQNLLF